MVSGDLSARGYGQPWSHTRSYSNRLNGTLDIKQNRNGAQWFLTDMPQLAQDGSGNIAVISVINDPLWFDKVGSNYVARYFIQETLAADTGNQQFIFTDTQGRIFKFHDFTVTGKEGQFKSFTDAFGHTNSATYDVNNLLTDYRNTSSAPTSAMAYAYYAGRDKDGRLQYATQQRDTTNIRQTVNDYYITSDTFGSVGHLKTVKLQQWNAGTSAWDDLGTSYYRYYKSGDAHGFAHWLKYVVGPEAYARMLAAQPPITPETATDTQIASYADHYFEYDTSNRVTLEKVKGGLYSYSYTYTASGDTSNNHNH